jgi:hypothetical protein
MFTTFASVLYRIYKLSPKNNLKDDSSYEFIGEVILKINVV